MNTYINGSLPPAGGYMDGKTTKTKNRLKLGT